MLCLIKLILINEYNNINIYIHIYGILYDSVKQN